MVSSKQEMEASPKIIKVWCRGTHTHTHGQHFPADSIWAKEIAVVIGKFITADERLYSVWWRTQD